jgi:AmmeMemoRadiSam system protein A
MQKLLDPTERQILLELARQALEDAVCKRPVMALDLKAFPERLQQPGVTFVTLTRRGELRGCIGALTASQPLVLDVQEHAAAAALQDYRFPPVEPGELDQIEIEISRLTAPQRLEYRQPQELLEKLRPHIDGVILQDGIRRATFLPQVWEKISDAAEFLSHLCYKMGVDPDLWRRRKLDVQIYQVEEFHEAN